MLSIEFPLWSLITMLAGCYCLIWAVTVRVFIRFPDSPFTKDTEMRGFLYITCAAFLPFAAALALVRVAEVFWKQRS